MYLINLIKEIQIWRKVKKIATENKEILNDKGFRIDWIGRIYTVINLPEEVANHNPQVQQSWILSKFNEFDTVFLDMGIADYIYPEFEQKTQSSYLLILSPNSDYVKLWPFIKFLFKVGLGYLILRILYKVIEKNSEYLINSWDSFINFIF